MGDIVCVAVYCEFFDFETVLFLEAAGVVLFLEGTEFILFLEGADVVFFLEGV